MDVLADIRAKEAIQILEFVAKGVSEEPLVAISQSERIQKKVATAIEKIRDPHVKP